MPSVMPVILLLLLVSCCPLASPELAPPCRTPIAGFFPMRRSPAGLQREAGARAALCDFYPGSGSDNGGCSPPGTEEEPGWVSFEVNSTNVDGAPSVLVEYRVYSESSSVLNSDGSAALEGIIDFLTERLGAAFLGPNNSGTSKTAQQLSSLLGASHISYASTSPHLSNKELYPTFFRTVPSDAGQGAAMVDLIYGAGWRKVLVIHSNDEYGSGGKHRANTHHSQPTTPRTRTSRQHHFPIFSHSHHRCPDCGGPGRGKRDRDLLEGLSLRLDPLHRGA